MPFFSLAAAEVLGPHVVARRVQLPDERVPIAAPVEVFGAGTRVEVGCEIEPPGGVHVARRVDRHRIAVVGCVPGTRGRRVGSDPIGPHQGPGRVPLRNERVVTARRHVAETAASELPGGVHVARRVHRHRIADPTTARVSCPAEVRGPHVLARRVQLRNERHSADLPQIGGCRGVRVEVDRASEIPGGVHVARRVDRHRPAIDARGAAEFLGPQVVARRVQLRDERVRVAV